VVASALDHHLEIESGKEKRSTHHCSGSRAELHEYLPMDERLE